jgi:predicted esterase
LSALTRSPRSPARAWSSSAALALCLALCLAACVTQSAPAPQGGDPATKPANTVTPSATGAAPAAAAPAPAPQKEAQEAPDPPPAPVVWRLPDGLPPAQGWPVILLMHGWRSNEQDFAPVAALFASYGVAAAAVPAIHIDGDPADRRLAWPKDDRARVHRYLQGVLAAAPDLARLDAAQVWLGGFSQGGMYALSLVADHPDRYLGALAISPAGWSARPQALTSPRPLFLIGGTQEIPRYRQGFLDAKALWERHPDAPLQVFEHGGGHHFPPDAARVLTDGLGWLRAHR